LILDQLPEKVNFYVAKRDIGDGPKLKPKMDTFLEIGNTGGNTGSSSLI